MFALGTAVFLPLSLFENKGNLSEIFLPLKNPLFIVSVFYLAVVSSVCAFLFINYSLNYIPAGRALVFSNFTTVISVLAGIFIMGDSFSLTQLFGIVVITLSVFGVSYRKNPAK